MYSPFSCNLGNVEVMIVWLKNPRPMADLRFDLLYN